MMALFTLLSVALMVSLCGCFNAAQDVVLEPPPFAILETTLSFRCSAQGLDDGATVEQIKWYHNQTEITAEQRNSRFNIRESGSAASILSIALAKRQDGGEYHCQVFISGTANPINSTSHTLRIGGVYSVATDQAVYEVELHSTFTVRCTVDAYPPPDSIMWSNEDSQISITQQASEPMFGILQKMATTEDNGRWSCTASNALDSLGGAFTVVVLVDSRIYLSVHNTIVVEGGSTIFECGYSGSGMITWRVNNIEFTPPRRPEKHSLSISDDRLLMLSDADLSMNGSRYQCAAESLISSTVHLFVLPAANIYLYFEDNNIMQINASSTYYSDTFPMITAFEHESSENYKNTKRLFSSFSTVSTVLNNCRNGSDHSINPSTPVVIIMIGILAPIICFAFGCGTCGILILVTRYNHLKEVTEIQTNRNEAYQTVNQRPEAVAQNPIYEHVA